MIQKYHLLCFLLVTGIVYMMVSCTSSDTRNEKISTDTATIAAGKQLFRQHCAACHQIQHDEIGPALGGITGTLSVERLIQFIQNPQQVIASGDPRAIAVSKKFNSVMPAFALPDHEIHSIISYLHAQPATGIKKDIPAHALSNPIPVKIPESGLSVDLELFSIFPSTSKNGELPLTRITKLDYQPGSADLFVADLRGQLYKLKHRKPVVFLDMSKINSAFVHEPGLATGLGSFAFHPAFEKNRLLYTTHAEKPGRLKADFHFEDSLPVEVQWVLTEWKLDDTHADTLTGRSRELLRIDMVAGAHGMQEIVFRSNAKIGDPDYGLLYVGVGDGASVQLGYPFVVDGKDRIWGSVLRINPLGNNSANGRYGIPAGNPFSHSSQQKSVREIYAYGFRNPHRITWNHTGHLLVSNIGQANIESLYQVEAGDHCGWPYREGAYLFDPYGDLNLIFPLPANDSIYKIKYPVAQYDHDEGSAIAGGTVYRGKRVPALKDKFLFGDIPSGRLFYIETQDLQKKQASIKEWSITINGAPATLKNLCGNGRVDLHFGMDAEGEMYLLTKADGKMYTITGAAVKNK